jgi:hypothetical protein
MAAAAPRPSKDKGEALDKAVRKLEAKEAKAAEQGKAGKPIRSVGREIRRGQIEGA